MLMQYFIPVFWNARIYTQKICMAVVKVGGLTREIGAYEKHSEFILSPKLCASGHCSINSH